jgi:hypothetical protein
LEDHIRTLVANQDLAPVTLWQDTLTILTSAYQTLLISPQAPAVRDRHILPLIDELASRLLDLTDVAARQNARLDKAIRDVPAAPTTNSVLVILQRAAAGSGVFLAAVGNAPGPASMAVAVLDAAAPHLVMWRVDNIPAANQLAGRLYRALVQTASRPNSGPRSVPLSRIFPLELIEAIEEGNLEKVRKLKVNWTSRFMNSPGWGRAVGIAGAITLLAALAADDPNPYRKWLNILSSASSTALGAAMARYTILVDAGIVTNLVRGSLGTGLGVVGALASVLSGAITFWEAHEAGDVTGQIVGGATSLGGLLLTAGCLIGATPIGVGLALVGAILSLGAAVISFFSGDDTSGSHAVFQAFIDYIGREGGPLDQAAKASPSLRAAFQAVQQAHTQVNFWAVKQDLIPQLFDLGFSQELIPAIIGKPGIVGIALVQLHLQRSGRIRKL